MAWPCWWSAGPATGCARAPLGQHRRQPAADHLAGGEHALAGRVRGRRGRPGDRRPRPPERHRRPGLGAGQAHARPGPVPRPDRPGRGRARLLGRGPQPVHRLERARPPAAPRHRPRPPPTGLRRPAGPHAGPGGVLPARLGAGLVRGRGGLPGRGRAHRGRPRPGRGGRGPAADRAPADDAGAAQPERVAAHRRRPRPDPPGPGRGADPGRLGGHGPGPRGGRARRRPPTAATPSVSGCCSTGPWPSWCGGAWPSCSTITARSSGPGPGGSWPATPRPA
jgi:hypothetical protein